MDDFTVFLLSAFFGMYGLGFALGISIHAFKTFVEKI